MLRTLGVLAAGVLAVATLPLDARQPSLQGAPPRAEAPSILPGTPREAFATILGNALSATSTPLANVPVRLRDARTGQILGLQMTADSGLFEFPPVDPGNYVVEILSEDKTTALAASQILIAPAGSTVSAVVKLPYRLPPFAGVLGNTPSSAAVIAAQAASAGLLAATVSGAATCDTLR